MLLYHTLLTPRPRVVYLQENGFSKVVFWGRINGITADYLIAQGYSLPYKLVDAAKSPATSFFR